MFETFWKGNGGRAQSAEKPCVFGGPVALVRCIVELHRVVEAATRPRQNATSSRY